MKPRSPSLEESDDYDLNAETRRTWDMGFDEFSPMERDGININQGTMSVTNIIFAGTNQKPEQKEIIMKATAPSLEDSVDLALNSEPRCTLVVLTDTSGSLAGEPIEAVNSGLRLFSERLKKDELASKRVEIKVIPFSSEVDLEAPFCTADEFVPPALTANGGTNMGAAIQKALDEIEKRKAQYRTEGIAYYRPWLWLITDGQPTDDVTEATRRIKDGERSKKFSFFAVGVNGADMDVLRKMSVREPVKLNELDFTSMFVWLADSLRAVSQSIPGDQVALPPVGWGKVE